MFAVHYAEQTFLDEGQIGKGYALICVSPPAGPQLADENQTCWQLLLE
jgi:hypothetical protein